MKICCDITGEERETKLGKNGPKLPRGWKRFADKIWSANAWKARYCLRTIYLPIRRPVEGKWSDLSDEIRAAWRASTEATRWAYKQLYMNDISRDDTMKKIPKMPPIYLYGLRRWDGWAASANCTLRLCEQTYRAKRYDIVWRGNARLPNSRYPQPFLVNRQNWSAELTGDGDLLMTTPLVNCRVSFLLKTHGHTRAANILKRVISGELMAGEAKIYNGKKGDVMCGISVWLPIDTRPNRSGTFYVRTDTESFLVGLNSKEEKLWVLNADDARRWVVQRDRALERIRQDQKFEARPATRAKREAWQKSSIKQSDRLTSFVQQTAAYVVGYAVRRNIARIIYDGREKSYFRQFPWYQFEKSLADACERQNIILEQTTEELAE